MPNATIGTAKKKIPGFGSLKPHQQKVWVAVFNDIYGDGSKDNESSAIAQAWGAARRTKVKKDGGEMNTFIQSDGENIAIGVAFTKVDTAARTVEGYATLDNVDSSNEIVDFDASREAFSKWLGNIREMHGPIAVGKAIQVEEKPFEKNGNTYNGMYVKAYISKGAPEAWEKCLDGTYTGFSVGGRVLEKRPELNKSGDDTYSARHATRITKYMLTELSLVDNPANPLAKFNTINKGLLLKNTETGMQPTDLLIEDKSLFFCEPCNIATLEDIDLTKANCLVCDNEMLEIAKVSEAPTDEELHKMVENLQKNVAPHVETDGSQNITSTDEGVDGNNRSLNLGAALADVDVEHVNPKLIVEVDGNIKAIPVQMGADGVLKAVDSSSTINKYPQQGNIKAKAPKMPKQMPHTPGVGQALSMMMKLADGGSIDIVALMAKYPNDPQGMFNEMVNAIHKAGGVDGQIDWDKFHELLTEYADAPRQGIQKELNDMITASMNKADGAGGPIDWERMQALMAEYANQPRDKVLGELEAMIASLQTTLGGPGNDISFEQGEMSAADAVETGKMAKDVTNAHKTPPKGYPSDSGQYGDPSNHKYPLDSPARIRSAMAYFNAPGQRSAGGYSLGQWASIGRRIASAANSQFGSGHSFSNGKVVTPDNKTIMPEDLQKNNNDDTNTIVNILNKVLAIFKKKNETPEESEGGDNIKLDTEVVQKLEDIYKTAVSEMQDVMKAVGVERLNDESGASATPKEIEVAKTASLAAGEPANGTETGEALATSGVAKQESWSATADEANVLPKAFGKALSDLQEAIDGLTKAMKKPDAEDAADGADDEAAEGEKPVKKAVDVDDLVKRLDALENSGATKKSAEVNPVDGEELKKSSIWNGMFVTEGMAAAIHQG